MDLSEDIKTKKIKYLTCNVYPEWQEELNFICVEQKCKENGLICSVCRAKSHQKCRVMPLKVFLYEISSKLKNKSDFSSHVDELLESVNNIQQSMLFSLKEIVEQLAKKIKTIEEYTILTFNKVKEKILTLSFMSENMPKVIENIMSGEYSEVDLLKDECKKLVEAVHYNPQSQKLEVDFRPEKVIDAYRKCETDFQKEIKKVQSTFLQSFSRMEEILEKTSQAHTKSSSMIDMSFSSSLKSTTIQIADKTATQTYNQAHDQRFALLDPVLDLNEKSRWVFQIKNLSNFIGIGICYKNHLQKIGYKFEQNNIGHGSYLISSTGYSWSHSKKEDNVAYKSFMFTHNDIIIVELDPDLKLLKFKKHGQQEKFSMSIQLPENDELYACVNLQNKNDKIEILSNIDFTEEM